MYTSAKFKGRAKNPIYVNNILEKRFTIKYDGQHRYVAFGKEVRFSVGPLMLELNTLPIKPRSMASLAPGLNTDEGKQAILTQVNQ